jgi:hypothetical protein
LPPVPTTGLRDNVAFSSEAFESGTIEVKFNYIWEPYTGEVDPLNPKITKFSNSGFLYSNYLGPSVLGLALQEFSDKKVGGFYGQIQDVFYMIEWIP